MPNPSGGAADRRNDFATVKNYIGRTDWDRGCVMKSNPDAAYFQLEEVMRPQFYANAGKWKGLDPDNPLIVTTISEAPFKGMDLVLRTADVLVRKYGRKFRWVVYGNTDAGFFENSPESRLLTSMLHPLASLMRTGSPRLLSMPLSMSILLTLKTVPTVSARLR